MSCTFYKTPRAHAVFSQPAASYSRASDRPIPKLKVKFFFTKIPLPSKPTLTERACGRRPCRALTSCVQLVASHFQGEQPDPGASKITVYRLHLRNPPEFRTLRRPPQTAGQIIFRMKELGKISQKSVASDQVSMIEIDDSAAGQRIDNFLLRVCKGVPKSHIYRILRSGEVRVNKGRIDAQYRLELGDLVRVPPIRVAQPNEAAAQAPVPAAHFKIIFEDEPPARDRQAGRRRGARRQRRRVRRDRADARGASAGEIPRTGASAGSRDLRHSDARQEALGARQSARADSREQDGQALLCLRSRRLGERLGPPPRGQGAAAQVSDGGRRAPRARAGRTVSRRTRCSI